MNVSQYQAMKAQIAALEARIEALEDTQIPLGHQEIGTAESAPPTLAVKRGPGRPRKEPEAA